MIKIINVIFSIDYKDYTADVEVDFHMDLNCGADADGKNGVEKLFIDYWEIIEVRNSDGIYQEEITTEMLDAVNVQLNDVNLDD